MNLLYKILLVLVAIMPVPNLLLADGQSEKESLLIKEFIDSSGDVSANIENVWDVKSFKKSVLLYHEKLIQEFPTLGEFQNDKTIRQFLSLIKPHQKFRAQADYKLCSVSQVGEKKTALFWAAGITGGGFFSIKYNYSIENGFSIYDIEDVGYENFLTEQVAERLILIWVGLALEDGVDLPDKLFRLKLRYEVLDKLKNYFFESKYRDIIEMIKEQPKWLRDDFILQKKKISALASLLPGSKQDYVEAINNLKLSEEYKKQGSLSVFEHYFYNDDFENALIEITRLEIFLGKNDVLEMFKGLVFSNQKKYLESLSIFAALNENNTKDIFYLTERMKMEAELGYVKDLNVSLKKLKGLSNVELSEELLIKLGLGKAVKMGLLK